MKVYDRVVKEDLKCLQYFCIQVLALTFHICLGWLSFLNLSFLTWGEITSCRIVGENKCIWSMWNSIIEFLLLQHDWCGLFKSNHDNLGPVHGRFLANRIVLKFFPFGPILLLPNPRKGQGRGNRWIKWHANSKSKITQLLGNRK